MSGETEADISGWTVDTLHSHVVRVLDELDLRYQQRFDAQQEALAAALLAAEKAVGTALTAAEKAVIKAETASDKRFEAVNEFRAQLADQAASFMPRLEADARFASIDEKITNIAKVLDRADGRTLGRASGVTTAQAIVGSIVGIILVLLAVVTFFSANKTVPEKAPIIGSPLSCDVAVQNQVCVTKRP